MSERNATIPHGHTHQLARIKVPCETRNASRDLVRQEKVCEVVPVNDQDLQKVRDFVRELDKVVAQISCSTHARQIQFALLRRVHDMLPADERPELDFQFRQGNMHLQEAVRITTTVQALRDEMVTKLCDAAGVTPEQLRSQQTVDFN